MAPGKPLEKLNKIAPQDLRSTDLPSSRTDVRAVALSGQNSYRRKHPLHSRSHGAASRSEPSQTIVETESRQANGALRDTQMFAQRKSITGFQGLAGEITILLNQMAGRRCERLSGADAARLSAPA